MGRIKDGTLAELILNEDTDEVEVIFYDKDTKKEVMRFPFKEPDTLDDNYCEWINTSKEEIKKAIKESAHSIIGGVYNYPLDKPE